jgi:hypothetical protein
MECTHCKKNFTNKSTLTRHQKTAKFCIKLQKETEIKENEMRENERRIEKTLRFICCACGRKLSSKQCLKGHLLVCEEYKLIKDEEIKKITLEKDAQIEKLDKQVSVLQDKLENIAVKAISRPTNTTTNKTQINNNFNLTPISDERFIESVSKLTLEYLLRGPQGYAQFALDHPLKDSVICSDYARRKVEYKEEDGTVKIDPEMTFLSSKFFQSIKTKNKELLGKYGIEIYDGDDYDFIEDETKKITEYITSVNKGSQGEKTDFHHDFVKEVCCRTVKE